MNSTARYSRGSIGIQLMIGVAVVFSLSTLLLPSTDDTIRSRVSQGLQQADAAKRALTLTCQGNFDRVVSSNADAGFYFVESQYVAEIRLDANCRTGDMGIHVRFKNTGAKTEPEILLSSDAASADPNAAATSAEAIAPAWRCGLERGEATHVPADCREARNLG